MAFALSTWFFTIELWAQSHQHMYFCEDRRYGQIEVQSLPCECMNERVYLIDPYTGEKIYWGCRNSCGGQTNIDISWSACQGGYNRS